MKPLQFKMVSSSLLALFLTITSCRSTEESINDTTTVASAFNVKIKLSGIETIEETPLLQASVNKKGISSGNIQQTVIPFEDNTFDIVYGRAVLHHAYDLKKLCQETARVLKPGGVLIATREHIISKKEDLPLFLASHPLHFLYGGENAYLLQEYLEALDTARLKLQKAIAPFESVINYAPMTQQDFSNLIKSVLAPIIGDKLGNWLANNETVQKFCGWYQSQKSDTPGRHYSFIAIKP